MDGECKSSCKIAGTVSYACYRGPFIHDQTQTAVRIKITYDLRNPSDTAGTFNITIYSGDYTESVDFNIELGANSTKNGTLEKEYSFDCTDPDASACSCENLHPHVNYNSCDISDVTVQQVDY